MVSTIISLSIYGAAAWLFASWIFNKVMTRISPKYAARRQLKQQKERDRQRDKRQKREADRKARLLAWAKAHPDDPAAKAILAEEVSATSSVDEEPDALGLLRQSQKEADDYERRREDRKAAEQLRSQQMLEWALANPASPEGRRHLEETLFEANKRVVRADQDLAFARYTAKDEGPEAIESATRISESEARKVSDEKLIADIQVALNRALSDAE